MDFEEGEVFTTLRLKIVVKDRISLKVVSTRAELIRRDEENSYGEKRRRKEAERRRELVICNWFSSMLFGKFTDMLGR